MSYTGIYSQLKPLKRKNEHNGVKIHNWLEFKKKLKNENIFKTAIINIDNEINEETEKIYKYLYGFKSYKRRNNSNLNEKDTLTVGIHYNILNLGFYYNKQSFIEFWKEISNYTEPFWFVHPRTEDGLKESGVELLQNTEKIVYVECDNGRITTCEYKIGVENIKKY